jgi:SAM-dependent methyltransferase
VSIEGAAGVPQKDYIGTELPVFAEAKNWKRYLRSLIARDVRGDVLEVGAGIGATAAALLTPEVRRWVAVEPDLRLASQIDPDQIDPSGQARIEVVHGTIESVPEDRRFDAVLYVDVIEHIEDDRSELARAAARLRPGGNLIIVAPAMPWAFSAFDRAVGHYRRYTTSSLRAAVPDQLQQQLLRYADCVGVLLSVMNRVLLRQSDPTLRQVRFWDRAVIPVSRVLDPLLRPPFGKSVVAVFRRSND